MLNIIRKHKENLFFYCLALSIVTLPSSIKANSISIMLLGLCWLLKDSWIEKFKNLKKNALLFFLFASLYVMHLAGMLYTSNTSHGFFELGKKMSLLIFPVILGTSSEISKENIEKIIRYFVISCLIVSAICLANACYRTIISGSFSSIDTQTNYVTNYFFYLGLSGGLIHAPYFSAFIAFCFLIILKQSIDNWQKCSFKIRFSKIVLLAYLLGFLVLLSVRITILFVLASGFLYVLFRFYKNTRNFKAIIIFISIIITGSIGVSFLTPVQERFNEILTSSYRFNNNPETNGQLSGKMDGIEMRLANWYFTFQAGKDHWLIGQGTGDDEDALMETYKKNNFMEGYIPKFNSHNQFLQTWLGLGAIGFFILLLNFFIPVMLAIRYRNYYYLVFLLLMMSFFLTESVLCRQHGIVFFSFFNSLFAFNFLKKRENQKTERTEKDTTIFGIFQRSPQKPAVK